MLAAGGINILVATVTKNGQAAKELAENIVEHVQKLIEFYDELGKFKVWI
jgi:hypothetical protein